jgi:hypothetical protein
MSMLPGAMRAKHKKPRPKYDWYIESRWASEQLFAALELQGPIHDPLCGEGRIGKAASETTGADIVDRGFPVSRSSISEMTTDRAQPWSLMPHTPIERNLSPTHSRSHRTPSSRSCGSHSSAARSAIGDIYQPCPPSLILACSERVNCPPSGIGAKEDGGHRLCLADLEPF